MIYIYYRPSIFVCTYEIADPLYGCISVTYVATIVFSGSLPMYYYTPFTLILKLGFSPARLAITCNVNPSICAEVG